MGIYDREYYRSEGPSFLGSLSASGRVCRWLIGINVACFLLQMLFRTKVFNEYTGYEMWTEPFTNALILDVKKVFDGQVWRLLTYAFLHSTGAIMHILFNMLFLYWFGRQVEDHLGAKEFLSFYLVSAVVAGCTFIAAYKSGFQKGTLALGASGAVTAVLVLSALYNPRQVIYLFFFIPVPIWAFVIFNVANDAFNFLGLLGGTAQQIAVSAHLGGAAFAFVYYTAHWRFMDLVPSFSAFQARRRLVKPRLKLYREDDEPATTAVTASRPASPERREEEQLEAQMDAILAKIPQVGMKGLTEHERELLVKASEAIKRRRE